MKHFNIPLLLLAAVIITVSGCRKSDRDNDTSTFSALDNAIAAQVYADIFEQVDEAAANEPGIRESMMCATITADTTSNPMVLTIDFGNTNCLGADGNNRRGVITATFTGKYRDPGTVISVSLQNYYWNDYKVEGTKTVTNEGLNGSGNLWYTVVVANAKITDPGGTWFVTWNSNRIREWIEGAGTATIWDDVYLIDGTASGVNRRGNSFEVEITSPLRIELGCRWIVSGTLEIKPQNIATRYVNYGNGGCDDDAVVTINGYDYNINMP